MSRAAATSNLEFYFFVVQLVTGIYRIFFVPSVAERAGLLDFSVAYAVVAILFGLPSIVDAVSYSMISPKSMDEDDRRWFRGYQVIVLIEVNMRALVSVYSALGPAMEHVHSFFTDRDDLLKLYSPSCSINGNNQYTVDKASAAEAVLLQPSCSLMNASRMACELLRILSSPRRTQFYSSITIYILMFLYMLMFGRSWSTYCWMSRLYLSFIVLYTVILLLHFFNALNMAKAFQQGSNPPNKPFSNKSNIYDIAQSYLVSLFLSSFFHVAIGYKVGKSTERNFIGQLSAVCLTNFVLIVVLSIINIMQNDAVMSLCNFNKSDLQAFVSLPSDASVMQRQTIMDSQTHMDSFVQAESINMLRETSGYTPWATYLPYQVLVIVFTMMSMCQYFIICDIHASIVFKGNSCYVFALSVFRFGVILALEIFTTGRLPKDVTLAIEVSISLTFLLLRMVHCIVIHFGKGFPEHLRSRRQLISEKSRIQLFVYDWYIAPGIAYLFNAGYPLMFILELIFHSRILFTLETGLFCLTAHILPSFICLVVSYCIPL